jgi:hypothetical protein
MTAISEQICLWLDARLAAISGVVEYERDPSGDPTDFPSVSLTYEGHVTEEAEAGTTRYVADFTIEAYLEGSSGAGVSAQMNDLHVGVVAAVVDPGNPPVGGLAERVEEGDLVRATAHFASIPRKGFRQQFKIQFSTQRGNPAAQ